MSLSWRYKFVTLACIWNLKPDSRKEYPGRSREKVKVCYRLIFRLRRTASKGG